MKLSDDEKVIYQKVRLDSYKLTSQTYSIISLQNRLPYQKILSHNYSFSVIVNFIICSCLTQYQVSVYPLIPSHITIITHMDRDIPSFNRSVMQRIYSKNHQMHLRRLKDIKSGISSHKSYNKPPYTNLTNSNSIITPNYHSKLPQYHNPKRQSIEQMNNNKIERENALLFKKMLKIMKRPDKNNDPTAPRYHVTGNQAKQRMSMQFSRINEENKTLFHRLQQQKPTIDMKKLQQERMKNLQILKFLGKYPNQQAMLRASQQQFHTFDLKSRKMNSTSNRIYYNNLNRQSQGQIQQQGAEQRFRNQMQGYDRELRELKDQTRRAATKNSRTIQKFTATSNNYYNPRRASHSGSHNGQGYQMGNNNYNYHKEQYANNQMDLAYQTNQATHTTHHPTNSTLSPDEPIPPARRKFLSQGGHRQTSYDPRPKDHRHFDPLHNPHLTNIHQNEYYQQVNDAEVSTQIIQQEKYPYHLNHPSNNIVIQDRLQNYYASNNSKRKTLENVREKKGIANSNNSNSYSVSNNHTHNGNNSYNASSNNYNTHYSSKNPSHQPLKPNIPKPYLAPKNTPQNNFQRKLNKKNSQSHIQVPQHVEQQPMIKPHFNILPQQFYHESMQEQEEEYFETEPSPQRVNKHADVMGNAINLKSAPQNNNKIGHNNYKREENMILLYKTAIELGKLIVKEQVQEMSNDISDFIKSSGQQKQQNLIACIMHVLSQQLRQIAIYRLSQCYKITISGYDSRLNNNAKKKRYQQHSSRLNEEQGLKSSNTVNQLDEQTLKVAKQYLQNTLSSIQELDIPEEEGSLLLEEIDYNYRHFIQHMVKVEKDNHEGNDQQHSVYRLVIVLDQAHQQPELKEEYRTNPLKQQPTNIPQFEQKKKPVNKPLQVQQKTSPKNINISQEHKQPQKIDYNHHDSDQQHTLAKPQAVSSNIPSKSIHPQQNQPANHEKSIYVQALDQQVL